jgi:hypothetical protein
LNPADKEFENNGVFNPCIYKEASNTLTILNRAISSSEKNLPTNLEVLHH